MTHNQGGQYQNQQPYYHQSTPMGAMTQQGTQNPQIRNSQDANKGNQPPATALAVVEQQSTMQTQPCTVINEANSANQGSASSVKNQGPPRDI